MNSQQAKAFLENAKSTEFKFDYGVIGNWDDVFAEIGCLEHGDRDSFPIINGELAGKKLSYRDGEFEIN